MPVSSDTESTTTTAASHARRQNPGAPGQQRKTIRAYVMDLWSIIPFYVGHLCAGLQGQSVDATLGSVRYHLDRGYFQRTGLVPDPLLLDWGGGFRSNLLRRLCKSGEYLANLSLLSLRFLFSRPDVLHVEYLALLDYGLPLEIWFLKWVRVLRVRIVYTVHNVTFQNAPGQHKDLYARAYRLADVLICHGDEARRELIRDIGIPADRIRVIAHGPLFAEVPSLSPQEARSQLGLPAEQTLVMCLGVISEYKGIPFLLDAWKRLTDSGVGGRLVIAGAGGDELLASIRDKVQRLDLNSSVILRLDYIPAAQLPLLYQAADILTYPYKAGTTSGALLTGLKYEKAVVATTLPFFREYLKDGENARLVEYGDVDALAAALRLLIEQPEERLRIRTTRNRHSPNEISWSEIAAATRECYQSPMHTPPDGDGPDR